MAPARPGKVTPRAAANSALSRCGDTLRWRTWLSLSHVAVGLGWRFAATIAEGLMPSNRTSVRRHYPEALRNQGEYAVARLVYMRRMALSRRWQYVAATMALIATLVGCGGSKLSAMLAAPTTAQFVLNANEKLNLDARGRSAPVVVRYYLMKNASAFNSADFFSLYERDQATLGDALLQREEFTLKPGETRVIEPRDAGDARVVGVMAAFRSIENSVWRGTAALTPKELNVITVTLQNNQLSVQAKVF